MGGRDHITSHHTRSESGARAASEPDAICECCARGGEGAGKGMGGITWCRGARRGRAGPGRRRWGEFAGWLRRDAALAWLGLLVGRSLSLSAATGILMLSLGWGRERVGASSYTVVASRWCPAAAAGCRVLDLVCQICIQLLKNVGISLGQCLANRIWKWFPTY